MRIIAVVRAAHVDAANQAVANATGRAADALTFTQPLERNGQVVAYWCNWNLSRRTYTRQQILDRLTADGGFDASDILVRATPSGDLSTRKMVVFDADRVTPEQFLAAHSLTRPDPID